MVQYCLALYGGSKYNISPPILCTKFEMFSLYTLLSLSPSIIGRSSNSNSFAADFLTCFRKAPYTEAVLAYLSIELIKLASK